MARSRNPGRSDEEARLDPIRWRRPGRGALLRLGVVAALLVTAALLTWSGPETCAAPAARPSPSPTPNAPKAKPGSAAAAAVPPADARELGATTSAGRAV